MDWNSFYSFHNRDVYTFLMMQDLEAFGNLGKYTETYLNKAS